MMNTRMKVFGEDEGIRLVIQGDSGGQTAYVDMIMDIQNTENLIEMLRSGITIHKGIRTLTCKTIAQA